MFSTCEQIVRIVATCLRVPNQRSTRSFWALTMRMSSWTCLKARFQLASRSSHRHRLALHVTVTPSGMSRKRVPKMVFMVRLPLFHSTR